MTITLFSCKFTLFCCLFTFLSAICLQTYLALKHVKPPCDIFHRFFNLQGRGSKRFSRHNRRHHARENSVANNLKDIFNRQCYSCDPEVLAFRSRPAPSQKSYPQEIRKLFREPEIPLSVSNESDSDSNDENESKCDSDFVVDSETESDS